MARTDTQHGDPDTATANAAVLRALQAAAALSVLAVLYQFVTAGQILADSKPAQDLHGTGAIAVHVIFGLTVLAAAAHWRVNRAPVWPAIVAVVVFALSFVQASLGDSGVMAAHVPVALVLTAGAVWIATWSFTPHARR